MKRSFVVHSIAVAAMLCTFSGPAQAQWLDFKTPGAPRSSDDKVDLSAPPPKTSNGTVDLSGIWRVADGRWLQNLAVDEGQPPLQPWAAALYKQRVDDLGKDRPSSRCLPHAVPDNMLVRSGPFKIFQTPGTLVILFEEMNHFRQIFTDGRRLPEVKEPAWFGYSVGKWEGESLVVETTGFHDRSWLDDPGLPHSDALRVIERFTRRDYGHLDIRITIDDPKAYTRPWSANARFELIPDTELLESICENEKDYEHTVK